MGQSIWTTEVRNKILVNPSYYKNECFSVFQVTKLVQETISSYGKVDFLVNNGGGQFMSPVSNMSAKGWRAVVDTNLNGTFLCCKEGQGCQNVLL